VPHAAPPIATPVHNAGNQNKRNERKKSTQQTQLMQLLLKAYLFIAYFVSFLIVTYTFHFIGS